MKPSQDYGRTLLKSLLKRGDRQQAEGRRPSVGVAYAKLPRTGRAVDDLHAVLESAAAQRAVSLKRGRHEAAHMIERIMLEDADRLAAFLGVERLGSKADAVARQVREGVTDPPDEVLSLLERCRARWARGESAWGIAVEETEKACIRFSLLDALFKGLAEGCDRRTFSTKATGYSKNFEAHEGMLAAMLKPELGDDEGPFARFGLQRFLHPVYLRGPVRIDFESVAGQQGCLPGCVPPFVSVDETWVTGLRWDDVPAPVVLTIENFASFNRHVREIEQPGVCVVYTAGFPNSAVLAVLARLRDQAANAGSPAHFFHWGDIDAGGVRILMNLEDELRLAITPHLMSPELAAENGTAADPAAHIDALPGAREGSAAPIIAHLKEGGRHLEQEHLAPAPLALSSPA